MLKLIECPDCGLELDIPKDMSDGEIISCADCGLELEYRNGKVIELVLEGEDWGE